LTPDQLLIVINIREANQKRAADEVIGELLVPDVFAL
jgi:hypothetical protein